jgi:uncharacterized membrane protein
LKKPWEFIKTTALGGLVLIIPLAAIGIAFSYIFNLLISVNNAIAKFLPFEFFGRPGFVIAEAVIVIVGVCFFAGLLLRTGFGENFADKLNAFLDAKLPMYSMVRNLAQRLTGTEVLAFTPAEVDLHGSGIRSLGFVIEELPDDRYAVFIPSSPALTIGQVVIAPKANVTKLDKSPKLVMDAITQWGIGTENLYTDAPAPPDSPK